MTEIDLTAGRIVKTGDPGHDTAAALAENFVGAAMALGADGSEIGAAIGFAVSLLWDVVSDADFAVVVESISRSAHGNRALRAANAAKKAGRLS
jgi:hypothetical protein